MNKTLLLSAALLAFPATVLAQRTYDQDKMAKSFADMKTHSWYTGGGWTTDFDEAKARAKEKGLPILAYFTRTYAP